MINNISKFIFQSEINILYKNTFKIKKLTFLNGIYF